MGARVRRRRRLVDPDGAAARARRRHRTVWRVRCAWTSDCMAVGQSVPPSTLEPIPLVEHWNGTSWSVERTPIPAHAGWAGELGAVSCASSGACLAVGFYFDNGIRVGTACRALEWLILGDRADSPRARSQRVLRRVVLVELCMHRGG